MLFGALAAAAGIAAAAYLWKCKSASTAAVSPEDRGVADVLRDCYDLLRDVQSGLSTLQDPS